MDQILRRMLYYEDVYDYSSSFEKYIPSYSTMSGKHKRALNVICTVASPVYKRSDEGEYLILWRDIDARGVRYQVAMEALTLYPLFIYTGNDWGHVKKEAKRYTITDLGKSILIDNVSEAWKYLRMKGQKGKLYEQSRVPRAVRGVSLADYCHSTEINLTSFNEYVKSQIQHSDTETYRMLGILKKTGCNFNVEYVRHSEGGRLFCVNGANMQNVRTDARNVAYQGCWDVDFENAHYSITHQLVGGDAIKHYVENTRQVREQLSRDLALPYDEVKTIMLMVIYNASFSGKDTTDLRKDYDAEKILEIRKHPMVREFINEVKSLDKIVEKEKGKVFWKDMPRERSLFLQRIEARMLDVCIAQYKPELLLFDGFITRCDVDVDLLKDIIYNRTGYTVNVTKEVIQA